ncbi:MAG: DegT/DnrJ/EryC1/StrS family aminotransferase [Armatimonadia bacterium]
MNVPFMDLSRMHAPLLEDIRQGMDDVIGRNDFILGREVREFEAAFARYCEAAHCVGLDNGSSALELCLRAWGIGDGDEVITAPNSFIASASGIAFTGARPVFADIDPATYTLDPQRLEAAITPRTRAIVPVHLYGQPADMDPIMEIARPHGLKVLEDSCQAHGARYKGKRCGSLGDAAAFSFYPAKNLGCFGDGGALCTNDPETAERVRMLRNYGQRVKYEHLYLAYNRRLDTVQAAVLKAKLPHLDAWNESRRATAARYAEGLEGTGMVPAVANGVEHVYHIYVVRSEARDDLAGRLKDRGIATGLHYPVPIHLQTAYRYLGLKAGDFPETERACREVLSLPMFPGMRDEEIDAVIAAVRG